MYNKSRKEALLQFLEKCSKYGIDLYIKYEFADYEKTYEYTKDIIALEFDRIKSFLNTFNDDLERKNVRIVEWGVVSLTDKENIEYEKEIHKIRKNQDKKVGGEGMTKNVNETEDRYDGRGIHNIECYKAMEYVLDNLHNVPKKYYGHVTNIIKYVWRCNFKGGYADLKKTADYFDFMFEDDNKEHKCNCKTPCKNCTCHNEKTEKEKLIEVIESVSNGDVLSLYIEEDKNTSVKKVTVDNKHDTIAGIRFNFDDNLVGKLTGLYKIAYYKLEHSVSTKHSK